MIEIFGVSYSLSELILYTFLALVVISIAIIGHPYSNREIESKKKMLILDRYNKKFKK